LSTIRISLRFFIQIQEDQRYVYYKFPKNLLLFDTTNQEVLSQPRTVSFL